MEVEERFTRQGDTPALGGALLNRGTFELAQGEFEAARALFDRASVHMHYQHLDRAITWVNLARAEVHAALGDVAAAQALLDEARATVERLGEPGGLEACAAFEARLQSPLSSH